MKPAWTPEAESLLRHLYPTTVAAEIAARLGVSMSTIYYRSHQLGLSKEKAWIADQARRAMQDLNHGGRRHQFAKGLVPWNKGTHFVAGGRSAETRFKPGTRQGIAAKNYQPIGAERLSKDGYTQRKINDDFPLQARWRGVHILNWEAVNGRLPKGHALVFRDGDKRNTDLANLELVTRAELMKRNSTHRHGPEIAELVQLRGVLVRHINKRTRAEPTGEATP